MEITSTQTASRTASSSSGTVGAVGTGAVGFGETLAQAAVAPSPAAGKADVVSGQLGVQLEKVKAYAIGYFDGAGQKLTQTTFDAATLLAKATQFGIPLSDLNGLADQLDAKGVSYKPYQMYAGAGSDAGIDLRDLATGGLGTAHDWRADANVELKGKFAPAALLANQTLATRLGLTPSGITRQTITTPPSAADLAAAKAINEGVESSSPTAPVPVPSAPVGQADVVSGRMGVMLDKGVRPYAVVYFNESGQKLTQTTFEPASILQKATQFGIPLSDLNGLADQLDAKGVSYKPYQLFAGTGSDAGIDLRDLANGGLGTAYDWRVDANVELKGKSAADSLMANQLLAQQLGLGATQPGAGAAQSRAIALWASAVQQATDTDVGLSGRLTAA